MEYKHRMKEALLFNVLVGIIARIIIIIARSPTVMIKPADYSNIITCCLLPSHILA